MILFCFFMILFGMLFIYSAHTILISKGNTSHTILYPEDVIVDGVGTGDTIAGTTTGTLKGNLGVVDTREVERTRRLGLVDGQTEGPRVERG